MFHAIFFSILFPFFFATPAFAHDCWLQPESFHLGLESLIFAKLLIGHRLKPDKELPLEKAMTPRLELLTNRRKINLLNQMCDGCVPAIQYRPGCEGPALLIMDRNFTTITLENDKFSNYVAHEGHETLLPMVEKNSRDAQKERYARCMKALLQIETGAEADLHDRVTGQKLEIIIRKNPTKIEPGSILPVDVFFEGQPLSGKDITAINMTSDGNVSEIHARTNQNGVAYFIVEEPGTWLLRLVHIYPYKGTADMDWESYWSAYCFEIGRSKT